MHMLRIETGSCDAGRTIIGVHGCVVAANVAVLASAVEASDVCGPPVLDLRGVRFADATAVDRLRCWVHAGVTLQGASLYLQALLAG